MVHLAPAPSGLERWHSQVGTTLFFVPVIGDSSHGGCMRYCSRRTLRSRSGPCQRPLLFRWNWQYCPTIDIRLSELVASPVRGSSSSSAGGSRGSRPGPSVDRYLAYIGISTNTQAPGQGGQHLGRPRTRAEVAARCAGRGQGARGIRGLSTTVSAGNRRALRLVKPHKPSAMVAQGVS
jgi:hypothetical protein